MPPTAALPNETDHGPEPEIVHRAESADRALRGPYPGSLGTYRAGSGSISSSCEGARGTRQSQRKSSSSWTPRGHFGSGRYPTKPSPNENGTRTEIDRASPRRTRDSAEARRFDRRWHRDDRPGSERNRDRGRSNRWRAAAIDHGTSTADASITDGASTSEPTSSGPGSPRIGAETDPTTGSSSTPGRAHRHGDRSLFVFGGRSRRPQISHRVCPRPECQANVPPAGRERQRQRDARGLVPHTEHLYDFHTGGRPVDNRPTRRGRPRGQPLHERGQPPPERGHTARERGNAQTTTSSGTSEPPHHYILCFGVDYAYPARYRSWGRLIEPRRPTRSPPTLFVGPGNGPQDVSPAATTRWMRSYDGCRVRQEEEERRWLEPAGPRSQSRAPSRDPRNPPRDHATDATRAPHDPRVATPARMAPASTAPRPTARPRSVA